MNLCMKAVVLFSGGKDSTAALHYAYFGGLDVRGLCIAKPLEDSLYFHYPYTEIAVRLAQLMGFNYYYDLVDDDVSGIKNFIKNCVDIFKADYIVAGILRSDFQRLRLEHIAWLLGKKLLTPLWGIDPVVHLYNLYKMNIRFIIVKAMASGIPSKLVGKELDLTDIEELVIASSKYKFNPAFEGGEAETLVTKAPLMRKRIITKGEVKVLSNEVLNYFIIHFEIV